MRTELRLIFNLPAQTQTKVLAQQRTRVFAQLYETKVWRLWLLRWHFNEISLLPTLSPKQINFFVRKIITFRFDILSNPLTLKTRLSIFCRVVWLWIVDLNFKIPLKEIYPKATSHQVAWRNLFIFRRCLTEGWRAAKFLNPSNKPTRRSAIKGGEGGGGGEEQAWFTSRSFKKIQKVITFPPVGMKSLTLTIRSLEVGCLSNCASQIYVAWEIFT